MSEPRLSHLIPSSVTAIRMIQKEVAEDNAMQVESQEDLNQYFETAAFNPMQRARNFRELDALKSGFIQKQGKEAEEVEETKILAPEKIDEVAERFQKNNYEMAAKTLTILRERISSKDTPEEVLAKVMSVYGDPALADEALDFLIETADPQTFAAIKLAKEQLNGTFEREIKAGRNMGAQAREFSEIGLGSPSSLRDMYRDITHTARDPLILFNELAEKFRYEKMKSVIHFLLHSLGSDLRSKGPSIPRGELKRLIDETRSLQGILGVFRFFQSRMKLMERQFTSYGLISPPRCDFETLARAFIRMLAERYINPEKILQTARFLGIDQEVAAQIIVYTQMRDAVKQVSPRYYRNQQHIDDFGKAFIEALDTLEDKYEEEEEEKQKKKHDKENK